MEYLIAVLVTFISVFLKGFQYKNVLGGHYKLVAITSYAMAVCDVLVINLIVSSSWTIVFACGTGATLGMLGSMLSHDKWVKK